MLCNKLTIYSTKCFILYTIKYIKGAVKVSESQLTGSDTVSANIFLLENQKFSCSNAGNL